VGNEVVGRGEEAKRAEGIGSEDGPSGEKTYKGGGERSRGKGGRRKRVGQRVREGSCRRMEGCV